MAVFAAAEGKSEPPPTLRYAWQCERWGALPNAGGLRDQPARMMADMPVAANVYNARKRYWHAMRNGNIVDWKRKNPDAWDIVAKVLELRREYGR